MRIYAKLTWMSLALSIIPLVVAASVFLYNAQKELTSEIYGRLNAVSSLKKDKLETFITSKKEDLRSVRGFVDVKINLPTLQQFDKDRYNFAYQKAAGRLSDQFKAFLRSYKYADVFLLDTKGKTVFVANPHRSLQMDKSLFTAEELEKAQEGIYTTGPVAILDKKYPYVLYMISAVNDGEQFIGYAVLVVDMNVIYEVLADNTGVGKTAETILVQKTSTGDGVAISPLKDEPEAILNREVPWQESAGGCIISEGVDYRKKQVLSVWHYIPSVDWGLVTKIDKDEAFKPLYDISRVFLMICIIAMLIIFFSSLGLARSISEPIYKLQEGAKVIGKGYLEHRVGTDAKDEVGQLSRTFDEMVDNLKKTLASRDELEKEVSRRKEAEEATKKLAEELHAMSVHDPLTGVLNRRGLQDVLTKTVAMSQRMGMNVQVLLLDLDDFKSINDTHGYGVGDKALTTVTESIRQNVRQTDHIARVGGDEFMVVLLDSREAEAIKVGDKIRVAISHAELITPAGEIVKITCSMGIAPLGDGPVTIESLLQKLYMSVHLSKGQGKNRIAYQAAGAQAQVREVDTTANFKKVLMAGDKFYAAAQPIFDLTTRKPVGYEMLARLDHDEHASPDEFFAFARNADLLAIVDHACLKACLKAVQGSKVTQRIHVNMFPSTLAETPPEKLVEDFASAKGVKFCLELNEQQILGDPLYLIPAVTALKKAGVHIALDDYGFGRSSVETLILLEPDIVKIDKKIVKDIGRDDRKLDSLKRLLRVIDSCKAKVIAEGIETQEDLDALVSLGVTVGQGYLLARPQIPPQLT